MARELCSNGAESMPDWVGLIPGRTLISQRFGQMPIIMLVFTVSGHDGLDARTEESGRVPIKSARKLEASPRYVVGLADEYPAGFVDEPHKHTKTQILYASSGVMSVVTDSASFVIPPRRAVWIPHGTEHEVSCRGAVSLRTLYVDSQFNRDDRACHIIEISPLLEALIVEVTQFAPDYPDGGREEQIVTLLLTELLAAPNIPYGAPMPTDPRLIAVCRLIIGDPASSESVDGYAKIACMSRRNFTRSFKRETGMGVAVWRQQVRLLEALSLLSLGASVTSAALDVGYESASAFSAMFQRAFGVAPSKYPF